MKAFLRRSRVAYPLVTVATATLGLAAQGLGPLQPTFKSGVAVVQLDVSALGDDGLPVAGLTLADFEVREEGIQRPVVAVLPIEVAGPRPSVPVWAHDVTEDVVSNEAHVRRVVVIVLDDANTGVDHGEPRSARLIANGIIDELGPDDLAAVTFTFSGSRQNLTTDRTRLRRAVDSFVPRKSESAGVPLACTFKLGGCAVDALASVGRALHDAPPVRKMVMFISTSAGLNVHTDPFAQLTPVQEMFRALQRANVAVYTFNPAGLTGPATMGSRDLWSTRTRKAGEPSAEEQARQGTDELLSLAQATGGLAVSGTNTPEAWVPRIFQQNRLYYLIGFVPRETARKNGDYHRIQVSVRKPGVTVRTRAGYVAEKPPGRKATRAPKGRDTLDEALFRGFPSRDLTLRAAVASLPPPRGREAVVAIAVTVGVPDTEHRERDIRLAAAAFDANWRKRAEHHQTIAFTPVSDHASFDTFSRLSLPPGQYEVRIAAETDGRTGSIMMPLEVPDHRKEAMVLSNIVLDRVPRGTVANQALLHDLLPLLPTASRRFARTDRVVALVHIYKRNGGAADPDTVLWRLVNSRGVTVVESADAVREDTGRTGTTAQIQVPLADLPPGDYMLSAEAARHPALRQRVVFSVQ